MVAILVVFKQHIAALGVVFQLHWLSMVNKRKNDSVFFG